MTVRIRSDYAGGLSPPTRGSRGHADRIDDGAGSIPAHAGKPRSPGWTTIARRVYPRPRGEALLDEADVPRPEGLSPPTRGSLPVQGARVHPPRSIPAHAGKPIMTALVMKPNMVYPRPRGEAPALTARARTDAGLSPPTRGSPSISSISKISKRSIPAHAGKPGRSSTDGSWTMVYPRPRGEAVGRRAALHAAEGLSPPTRGSLRQSPARCRGQRSIPAHAGKPGEVAAVHHRAQVYPRPRGEASSGWLRPPRPGGLSPPTRGSLNHVGIVVGAPRSIPAHAGKPGPGHASARATRVYPRPRGEAHEGEPGALLSEGLSPPTRGSPAAGDHTGGVRRSIPAHAGKP